jgi:spore germination protein GerM
MKRIIGLILLVTGIAVGIYGYYEYQSAQQSLGNVITKVFTGTSQTEQQSIYLMIGGGAVALIGLGVSLSGPTRRRR